MTVRVRRVAVAAALAGAALLVAACSSMQAGAAATLGDERITESQLASTVEEVLEVQGLPLDTPDPALVQETLTRMIIIDLVDVLAEREGVVVTQGRIDETYQQYVSQSGDVATMEGTFIQQGVAPSQIKDFIRLNLQAEAVGAALAPDLEFEAQGAAVFEAAAMLSEELGVQTAPRYGVWDSSALAIGSIVDDLTQPPTLEQ